MKKTSIIIIIFSVLLFFILLFGVLALYLSGVLTKPYTEKEIVQLVSAEVNSKCIVIEKERAINYECASIVEKKEMIYTLKSIDNDTYYIVRSGIYNGSLFPEAPHKYYTIVQTYNSDAYDVKCLGEELDMKIKEIAEEYGYKEKIIDDKFTYSFSVEKSIDKDKSEEFFAAVYKYLTNRADVSHVENSGGFIVYFKDYEATYKCYFNSYID